MGCKEFLRPEKGKVILFIILFVVSSISSYYLEVYKDVYICDSESPEIGAFGKCPPSPTYVGFPLPYLGLYQAEGNLETTAFGSITSFAFFILLLLIDVLSWYVISCLIVLGYKKFVK